MTYKKIYEMETGKKVPKGYEIHHLDLNHDNNDIENMVAIPKELHREFHKAYSDLHIPPSKESLLPYGLMGHGLMDFYSAQIKNYADVYSEICSWILWRDDLRGIIPCSVDKFY